MGSSPNMVYKYSIDGPDDEAAFNQNHVRYIRSTATGAYSFPVDTFGNQYNEAFVPDNWRLAPASAGKVSL